MDKSLEEESGTGRVFFVSGIDTDVGKTVVTGLMAHALAAAGIDVITVKMVQTGCEDASEDLTAHRSMCGLGLQPEDAAGFTAPQIFKFPSSPSLAARLEGRCVDLRRIEECVDECARRREIVLVEGAGGMLVPLSDDVLAADFAAGQGWPLILVTCGRLGSVNHTILSLEAAKSRGMHVAGVVHNWHADADPTIDADAERETRRCLARLGFPDVVVRVPRVEKGSVLPQVDFSEIFS